MPIWSVNSSPTTSSMFVSATTISGRGGAVETDALRAELSDLLSEQHEALEDANEDQTEERWVKPVLQAMDWDY